jgi:hypothetical protein
VELRGCYSNPHALDQLELAKQAIELVKLDGGSVYRPPASRRWKLVDRLGELIIRQLVEDRQGGVATRELVERYGISLSSVKRILRREAVGAPGRSPARAPF